MAKPKTKGTFPKIRDKIYRIIGIQNEVNESDGFAIWVQPNKELAVHLGEKLRSELPKYDWKETGEEGDPNVGVISDVWQGSNGKFILKMYVCTFKTDAALYVGGWPVE